MSEAIEKWRNTLKNEPNDLTANYSLGLSYANAGIRDQALEQFRKSIGIAPEIPEFHVNLAMALQDDGSLEVQSEGWIEAKNAIQNALRLDADFAEAKGLAYLFTGIELLESDPSLAQIEFQNGLECAPTLAILWGNLAHCCKQQGKNIEAIRSYKQAIRLCPTRVSYFASIANLLIEQIELEDALEATDEGLRLLETQPNIDSQTKAKLYDARANVKWRMGDSNEASLMSKNAIAHDPQNTEIIGRNTAYKTSFDSAAKEDFDFDLMSMELNPIWFAYFPFAFAAPPIAILFTGENKAKKFFINLILCCFFYVPGIIHALYCLYTRPNQQKTDRPPQKSSESSAQPTNEADIQAAIRAGRKLEAIKIYRSQTGASLAEGKRAIEEMMSKMG